MRGERLEVANKIARRRVNKGYDIYDRDRWRLYRKVTSRCSCWMCGHQRKHNGPKISEQREMQDESLQMVIL